MTTLIFTTVALLNRALDRTPVSSYFVTLWMVTALVWVACGGRLW